MVDIVSGLGADPNGGEIGGILENNVGSGTVIEFPSSGEFVVSGSPTLQGDGFELRGNGATLIQGGYDLFDTRGTGYVVDGFEVDVSQTNQRTNIDCRGSGYEFSRMIFRGHFEDTGDKVFHIHCHGDGATFDSIYFPERQVPDGTPYGVGGMGAFGHFTTQGGIDIRNCYFRGFGGTSLYMSQTESMVTVENCFFYNTMNGLRAYRLTMRNCTTVLDGTLPDKRGSSQTWTGWMAAPWLDGQQSGYEWASGGSDVLIEDCDAYFTDGRVMAQGVLASRGGTPGDVTVRNCRIHNTSGHPSINLDSNSGDEIRLENVTVSGNDDVQLNGNVVSNDWQFVSGEAADPSPPIVAPPDSGVPTGNPIDDGNGGGLPGDGNGDSGPCSGFANNLLVTGTGTPTQYTIEVSGDLQAVASRKESHDTVQGRSVDAWITSTQSIDQYCFDGTIDSFGYVQGGPVELELNGSIVSDDQIVGMGATPGTGNGDGNGNGNGNGDGNGDGNGTDPGDGNGTGNGNGDGDGNGNGDGNGGDGTDGDGDLGGLLLLAALERMMG